MSIRNTASTAPAAGYRHHSSVDLKRDRRVATAIQVVAVLIAGAMVGLVFLLDLPLASSWNPWVTVAACLVYMGFHVLTHGAVLWLLSGARPTVAMRFPYLTTGSQGGHCSWGAGTFGTCGHGGPGAIVGACAGPDSEQPVLATGVPYPVLAESR